MSYIIRFPNSKHALISLPVVCYTCTLYHKTPSPLSLIVSVIEASLRRRFGHSPYHQGFFFFFAHSPNLFSFHLSLSPSLFLFIIIYFIFLFIIRFLLNGVGFSFKSEKTQIGCSFSLI